MNGSPKHIVQFGVISALAVVAAALVASSVWARILFLWIAVTMLVVAIAYALNRWPFPIKREDGSQPLWAWFILWPHLLLTRFSFLLCRILNHHAVATAEASPRLWFSRRLSHRELSRSNQQWRAVLDLASEFPRMKVDCKQYRSMPLLDGAVPTVQQLQSAIEWIDQQLQHGPVLVHCALGHGRTGSVVLAWLMLRQQVTDLQSGITRLRELRSSFGISASQAACIEGFLTAQRRETAPESNHA